MIRNKDLDSGRFKFGNKASILLILNYFLGYNLIYPTLASLIYPPSQNTLHPKAQMISTLITLILSIYLVRDTLKRSFRYFKTRIGDNSKVIIRGLLTMYGLNIVLSLIIYMISGESTTGNQELIESGFSVYPVLYAFTAVIFAPIVEELIFRGVLYQELRSKNSYKLPIIISSLSFGLIHTLPIYLSGGNSVEMLFLLIYTAMGFILTMVYEKTGSIYSSITLHLLNNLIATIVLITNL